MAHSGTQTFNLWWSPEGRIIATVQAASYAEAIKLTPKPYNKAKGEVYATNAFKAVVSQYGEGFLLGGGKRHESTPFRNRKDAEQWGATVENTNRKHLISQGFVPELEVAIEPVFCKNPLES